MLSVSKTADDKKSAFRKNLIVTEKIYFAFWIIYRKKTPPVFKNRKKHFCF